MQKEGPESSQNVPGEAAPTEPTEVEALEATTPPPASQERSKRKPDPLIGKVVGGCKVLSLLGRGSMGAVYLANQESLDRQVALKTIRAGLLDDEGIFLRFRQEARTVSRFNTPHVVQIHEVGVDEGIHFLVMEYVGGGNLKTYTRSQPGSRLTPADAVKYLAQAAMGLIEAENLGVIHRDIKPENLLLRRNGRLKITDFGIAKIADSAVNMTMDSAILGTPLYMSPEQAQGNNVDSRADIYALGATFYHLLTGKPPVEGDTAYKIIYKKVRIEYLAPLEVLGESAIPESLNQLIRKTTARNPEDRYQSFKDLLMDTKKILEGNAAQAVRVKKQRSMKAARSQHKKQLSRRRMLAPVFLLATLALLALVVKNQWVDSFLKPASAISRAESPELTGAEPRPGDAPGASSGSGSLTQGADETSLAQPNTPAVAPDPELPSTPAAGSDETALAETSQVEVNRIDPAIGERIADELADLRERIRSGESRTVPDQVRRLEERLPDDASSAKLRTTLDALKQDALWQKESRDTLESIGRPSELGLTLPLDELPGYVEKLKSALGVPADASPELRDWLETERRTSFAALREELRPRLRELSREVRDQRRGLLKGQVSAAEIKKTLANVELTAANLKRAFPGRPLRKLGMVLPVPFKELRQEVERHELEDSKVAEMLVRVDTLAGIFGDVNTALDWTEDLESHMKTELDSLSSEAKKIFEDGPNDDEEKRLARGLESLEEKHARWARHREQFGEALAELKERRLEKARAILEKTRAGSITDPLVERTLEGVVAFQDGFREILDELDPDAARKSFSKALERLEPHETIATYPRACLERLDSLDARVGAMVAVVTGEVRLPKSDESRSVAGFFMDRIEVRVGEFREFIQAEKKRPSKDAAERWGSRAIFERSCREPEYFSESTRLPEDWPVEEVNYYQARAFLRATEKDLPTLAEWWLAARGPLMNGTHRYKYPSYPSEIRRATSKPVPVTRGGKSRVKFPGGQRVHHLAGNVAEWLKVKTPKSRSAQLVGGRYLDDVDRYFSGQRRDTLELGDTRRGYGFRGVIRPREFFGEWVPE